MWAKIIKFFPRLLAVMQSNAWLIPIMIPLLLLSLLFSPIVAFALFAFATFYDILGGSSSFLADATHVPTFYVPKHRHSKWLHNLLLMTLGTLFGIIHCAGWNIPFPTHTKQTLWHVASLVITVFPTATLPFTLIVFFISVVVEIVARIISLTVGVTVASIVAPISICLLAPIELTKLFFLDPFEVASLVIINAFFGFPTFTANINTSIDLIGVTRKIIDKFLSPSSYRIAQPLNAVVILFFIFNLLMYASARLLLLGLALAVVNHQPLSAFVAVDWTKFYPHIS